MIFNIPILACLAFGWLRGSVVWFIQNKHLYTEIPLCVFPKCANCFRHSAIIILNNSVQSLRVRYNIIRAFTDADEVYGRAWFYVYTVYTYSVPAHLTKLKSNKSWNWIVSDLVLCSRKCGSGTGATYN